MSQIVFGAYGVNYRWRALQKESKGGASRGVLEDVSFEISRGEFLALFGPNGSGKSTLMKVVAGILPLNRAGCSAQVRYLNQNFLSFSPRERAQCVAYVAPDLNTEFPLTAEETVSLGRTCQGVGLLRRPSVEDQNAVRWAMEKCLCWSLRDRSLESLSGGERQLVALARGLAQGAKILFLDEALSRMDLHHQAAMGKMLRELAREGWSILLVSHDVNLASEWAVSGIFLREGKKILQGAIREILTQDKIRTLYPGSNLISGSNPVTGAPKIFFGEV